MNEDKLISMYEAAKILGTSKASVGKWAKAGILTPIRSGGHTIKFYLSEVVHLKNLRIRGLKPHLVGEELVILKYKMAKMERLMESICLTLKTASTIESFTDSELVYWHGEATKVASHPTFHTPKFDFKRWHVVMQNIHELEMKRMKHLTGDPVPYVPFIALCERVISMGRTGTGKKYKPMRCSEWVDIYVLTRNMLRDRAITFLTIDPYDFNPIKRVDATVTNFLDRVLPDQAMVGTEVMPSKSSLGLSKKLAKKQ